MDQTYIHLVVTHLPIFGSSLGALVLIYALLAKSGHTKNAAYGLFLLSSLGAGIAYLTGEGAEEAVEHMPGINESMIEAHEDFAIFTLCSLIALGILSAIALFLTKKRNRLARPASLLVLFVSMISFALAAQTAHQGGQIRHTEIGSETEAQKQDHNNDSD